MSTPSSTTAVGAGLATGAATGALGYLTTWGSLGLLGKTAVAIGLMANPAVAVGVAAGIGGAALAGGAAWWLTRARTTTEVKP